MHVEIFHDKSTATFTYVVVDESSKKCAVIDSVLEYDQFSGEVSYESANKVVNYVQEHKLQTPWSSWLNARTRRPYYRRSLSARTHRWKNCDGL
ncbi:hypothetical protein P4S73_30305 [Paraglaciecola sp. Hal342]